MSKYKIQSETIIVSIYCNIILNILITYKELSINKLIFFSYLIKRQKGRLTEVYSARHSKDILLKCISYLSGNFESYCKEIRYVVKAIHILINNGNIIIENDKLIYNNGSPKKVYIISKFIDKAIKESEIITDRQFLREVIRSV